MDSNYKNYTALVATDRFAEPGKLSVVLVGQRGISKEDVQNVITGFTDEEKHKYEIEKLIGCIVFTFEELRGFKAQFAGGEIPEQVNSLAEFKALAPKEDCWCDPEISNGKVI